MPPPRTALALALGSALLILIGTLFPLPGEPVDRDGQIQRQRPIHLADGLRNVALFAPFGAGLAGLRWRPIPAVGMGLLFSAGIEMLQNLVPGRHPGLPDVFNNALGTAVGFGLLRSAPHWVRPSPWLAARLAVGIAGLAGLAFAATGPLFAPHASPGGPAFGHVPPRLEHLPPYPGRVLRARVADVEIPTGALSELEAEALRRGLRGDRRIEIDAVAGVPALELSGLLVVNDEGPFEMVMVGVLGSDLLYRYLTRGRGLGFERATLSFSDLLAGLGPGERFRVQIEHRAGRICAALGPRRQCLGYSPADGWRLLLGDIPPLVRWPGLSGALWLAACWLPLGFWARTRRGGAAAVLLGGAGLAAAPALGPVLLPPLPALLAAVAGFGLGRSAAGRVTA